LNNLLHQKAKGIVIDLNHCGQAQISFTAMALSPHNIPNVEALMAAWTAIEQ
jgi:hypothetical protein